MKVSLHWLSEWVDVGSDVASLSHQLTMAGLEIEGQAQAAPPMSGVVVAEVRTTEKHPDAEKLNVCRVFDGQQEVQIVCGASNVRPGIKVPLATVGASLHGGLQIKQAKLRGVDSFGMLCSAKELGLAEESQGLLELPAELVTGMDLRQALQLDDVILEINLTPNRGDCMSILGVAREIAAATEKPLVHNAVADVPATIADQYPVTIASLGCGKFVSRVVKGIRPAARSPWWLQERLRRAGVRSINAVVDVTNYVMLEFGQPMHAYDLSKLHGGLTVRQARANETATLLDDKTITLTDDVLVIADDAKALGLAGVMGGLDAAISDTTTDVLLEVASFEPDAIAGRGRRYGLVTDASQRFERGVDPNLQQRVMQRATQLLLDIAGGQAGPMQVTGRASEFVRQPIALRLARVERVLGLSVERNQVTAMLNHLGMQVDESAAGWQVVPPSWRFDINIEADLIEEVARCIGYDHIPAQPEIARQQLHPVTEKRVTTERLALLLVDRGYQEAITYSFTDPAVQGAMFGSTLGLSLANPISADLGVMRLSLWPGLLKAAQSNLRRQQSRVRLFETGRLFSADGREERAVIGGAVTGSVLSKQWAAASSSSDFFDVKADVETLLALTGNGDSVVFRAETHPALHPGQSARVYLGEQAAGWLGTLSPVVAKRIDIEANVVLFELELGVISVAQVPVYKEISRFPEVRRDIAMVVAEELPFEAIQRAVRASAGGLLRDLNLFDVYRGDNLEKGKKSMALGLYLQDTSKTLTDTEVEATLSRVIQTLQQRFAATIRDK